MSTHVDLSGLEGPFKDLEMRRLCRPENDYRPEVWVDGEVFKFNITICTFRLPDLEERRWAKLQEEEPAGDRGVICAAHEAPAGREIEHLRPIPGVPEMVIVLDPVDDESGG